jgi:sulfur relay protein TusB/DsrH
MSNKTLYLVQSSFHTADTHLNKLANVFTEQDAVVLMGDAVLHHQHETLTHHLNVYALTNDLEVLGQVGHDLINIGYDQFADLCLQFTRCISLK